MFHGSSAASEPLVIVGRFLVVNKFVLFKNQTPTCKVLLTGDKTTIVLKWAEIFYWRLVDARYSACIMATGN